MAQSPPSGVALPLQSFVSGHPLSAAHVKPGLCFSYDDKFFGQPGSWNDLHRYQAEAPVLAAPTSCVFERFQSSGHGDVEKSGYVCSQRDEFLLLNTTGYRPARVRIGFVSSPRTRASASLSCEIGCACEQTNLNAFAAANTLLKEGTVDLSPTLSEGHCLVRLSLLTSDGPFKFVSITVIYE